MKRDAFTLIEVLISMLLLSFLIVSSLQAYKYILSNHQINEIRYLVLNRLDSEMNRLVFAYENLNETTFTFTNADTEWGPGTAWNDWYDIDYNVGNARPMKIYNRNPVNGSFGLRIEGPWNHVNNMQRNIIEIVDRNNNPNVVDSGDVVGLMAWRIEHNGTNAAHLSLTIEYPYIGNFRIIDGDQLETNITQINNVPIEFMNIKTSTQVR